MLPRIRTTADAAGLFGRRCVTQQRPRPVDGKDLSGFENTSPQGYDWCFCLRSSWLLHQYLLMI